MSKTLLRRTLSAPGLLGLVRGQFERVNDPVGNPRISLADCLMSALAVFDMKHSSLLKFQEGVRCGGRFLRGDDAASQGLQDGSERLGSLHREPSRNPRPKTPPADRRGRPAGIAEGCA